MEKTYGMVQVCYQVFPVVKIIIKIKTQNIMYSFISNTLKSQHPNSRGSLTY
jgi:hypothetical protein